MYSELIVMILAGKEDLENARQALEKGPGGQLFKLIDMVLIHQDTIGIVSFQARRRDFTGVINDSQRLAGAFAKAIFGISRVEDRRHLVKAGLDPYFLKEIDQDFKLDSTAYLIHVPGESLIDTRRYLEILGQMQGTLFQTTFRSQVEEVLLKKNG